MCSLHRKSPRRKYRGLFLFRKLDVYKRQEFRVESLVMEGITRVKSRKFAVRIVRLYQFLCNERKEFVLSKQLLRSGTGIGANLAEAECAISKKDFLSKIYIALKECSETLYWLDLLKDTSFLTEEMHASIYRDGEELKRLLTSTTKTVSLQIKK